VAKRRKKPATAKKPAKKKANARPKKGAAAEKPSNKRKGGAKRGGTAAPNKAASRAGSATLLPPKRPRTTARSHEMKDTAGEAVTTSNRGIAGIDEVRMINHADQAAGGSCPTQTGEHAPPTNAVQIAGFVAEQGDRLKEIADRLADADKDELLRLALWWADTPRKPRAAIVGRALHELKSFDEEWAFRRGTADKICREIRRHNRLQLRPQIHAQLDSKKDQEKIDSALVGLLNRAWAVLEKLDLLRAAPSAGVYLIGRGLKVFDGFPDWNKPEEPMPKKPMRPPRKPRS
jgi:hypothetical protein